MKFKNLFKPKIVAEFEKVSFEQYVKDWQNIFQEDHSNIDTLRIIYDSIKLPERATDGSAGYDFITPFNFKLPLNHSITIPTGIRCKMKKNFFLMIVPRSGQGFKYRLSVVNTTGIIDSDYYGADNEGHILIKIIYDGDEKHEMLSSNRTVREKNGLFIKSKSITKNTPTHIRFEAGKGFAQGMFLKYFISKHDSNIKKQKRIGGTGSTDRNK